MLIRQLYPEEYHHLGELSRANDLEEPSPEDVAQLHLAWGLEDAAGLVQGCVALFERSGHWVLDCLAVNPTQRGGSWGRRLVETAETYLANQPQPTLYLVTKVPPFFAHLGYQEIPREAAPDFSECFRCSRYQQTCFPQVMSKVVRGRDSGDGSSCRKP